VPILSSKITRRPLQERDLPKRKKETSPAVQTTFRSASVSFPLSISAYVSTHAREVTSADFIQTAASNIRISILFKTPSLSLHPSHPDLATPRTKMPSKQTHLALAHPAPISPAPRRALNLLSLTTKAFQSPYAFVQRSVERGYAAPPPPPPSPVNFPGESWSRR